jgi:large subunit ribosomal protein L10
MSKYVKNLIINEITNSLKDIDGVVVINPRGINGIKSNQLRRKLHENKLQMTVVRNALARRALQGSKLKGFESLLEGPSAVVYGQQSVPTIARLLLAQKKDNDKLEIRGAFFDGEVFAGEKGVKAASEMPTREEAISGILSALLGPGASLAAALSGPASTLASLVKAIEDKAEKAGGAEAAPAA